MSGKDTIRTLGGVDGNQSLLGRLRWILGWLQLAHVVPWSAPAREVAMKTCTEPQCNNERVWGSHFCAKHSTNPPKERLADIIKRLRRRNDEFAAFLERQR